jgi:hypothetical protein
LRLRNLAVVQQQGLDANVTYTLDTDFGRWDASVNTAFIFDDNQAVTAASPLVDLSNTVGNPLRFKGQASLTWSSRAWEANGTLNYTNGYNDASFTPAHVVASWTTLDLGVSYKLSGDLWGDGTRLLLNVTNVTDADPPFVNTISQGAGYDAFNANPLGRVIAVQAIRSW